MKRKFLVLFAAFILIAVLAFVTAPAVKAETAVVLNPADLAARDYKITENGLVLDLQGQNLAVEIVGADTVLSVIDTKNTALSGEGAGELTVTGDGSVALETVDTNATNRRSFLRIQNDNGTYSFHPIYLTIKQIGVNTHKSTLCLQALFVTNEIAQAKIETGVVYTTNDGREIKESTGDAFSFESGFLYSYYDLMGSLVDENGGVPAAFETKKSFKAYISVKDEGEATVYREISQAFSPKEVMEKLDEIADSFSDVQKAKLVNMITGKPHLETLCGNFLGNESTTPIVADGKYYIVAYTGEKYYAMTDNYAGNAYLEAEMITLNDGVVTGNATAWTLTNDGKGNVTLMSPKGDYLMRVNNSANILVGATAEKWLVAKAETTGAYTLQHTNSDTRYLAYNFEVKGFKAYKVPTDHVIELLIVPAKNLPDMSGNYVISYYNSTDGSYFVMDGTVKDNLAVNYMRASDLQAAGLPIWTIRMISSTLTERIVTLQNKNGEYLARSGSNMSVQATPFYWIATVDENGNYQFSHNDGDETRRLMYSVTNTGFKAYVGNDDNKKDPLTIWKISDLDDSKPATYTQITAVEDVTVGDYLVVVAYNGKYYLMTKNATSDSKALLAMECQVTDGKIVTYIPHTFTFANATGGFTMMADGRYLNNSSDSATVTLVEGTGAVWEVSFDENAFYLKSNGRLLMYTEGSRGFKSYAETKDDNDSSYKSQLLLFKKDDIVD